MLIFLLLVDQLQLFLFRQKGIFLFNPFLKVANPQLADKNSLLGLWFQYQFNLIYVTGSQAEDGPDTDNIIFVNPVKLTRVKHFIDIP